MTLLCEKLLFTQRIQYVTVTNITIKVNAGQFTNSTHIRLPACMLQGQSTLQGHSTLTCSFHIDDLSLGRCMTL